MSTPAAGGIVLDPRRVGAQRPRISRCPSHESSAGPDAVDVMRLTGTTPDDWQEWVLDQVLAEREDGRLLPFEVGLIVPRQSGKNYILEARMLTGVLLLGEKEIIYSAQSLKTAKKAHRHLAQLIRSTPSLFRRLLGWKGQKPTEEIKGIKSSGLEMSIEFADGARIDFVTRTKDSVRGFTGDLVIIDEAYNVDTEEIAAMLPTIAARTAQQGAQVWYVSSAARAYSDFLRQLRERAQAPEGRERLLCYMEWSAPETVDTVVEEPTQELIEAIYQANPGVGSRIDIEYILETEFGGMTDTNFRCERLGIPVPVGSDDFIPSQDWLRCRDAELIEAADQYGEVDQGLVDVQFAIDVSPNRSTASIGLAGMRSDGRVYIEHVDSGDGVDWIPSTIAAAWRLRPDHPVLIQEGSSAEDIAAAVRRAGVPVRAMVLKEYAAACGRVLDGIKGQRLAHSGQEELDQSVRAARPSYKGDTRFIWKRAHALADLTPLVTVTLASNAMLRRISRDAVERPEDDIAGPKTRGGRLVVRRARVTR